MKDFATPVQGHDTCLPVGAVAASDRFAAIEDAVIECQALAKALYALHGQPECGNSVGYLACTLKEKLEGMDALFVRQTAPVMLDCAAVNRAAKENEIFEEAVFLCGLIKAADSLLDQIGPGPRGHALFSVIAAAAPRADDLIKRIDRVM